MLSYHLNPVLKGYKASWKPNIFNSVAYQQNQQYNPLYSFYILDEQNKTIHGLIHFTKVGDFASSQPRGPFGGFELDSTVDEPLFVGFIDFIDDTLRKKGINRIKLVEPPDVFLNDVSFDSSEVLSDNGYEILFTEINHFVNLEELVGVRQIHQMERRNFRKALAKNYRWKLEAVEALPEVYSFIERCRKQQDLKVNITYDDLANAFKKFPGKYRIFSIRHSDYLTAASITVEVNKSVMYNYLPASDKRFHSDSPMVFLLVSLYKYAKSLGYEVLDLGVSSVNGEIQSGLAEFKERMGALICEKRILQKTIS